LPAASAITKVAPVTGAMSRPASNAASTSTSGACARMATSLSRDRSGVTRAITSSIGWPLIDTSLPPIAHARSAPITK